MNVALPAIGAGLHGGAADMQWVLNAYLLPFSALVLLGGAAGDRFGQNRLLTAGSLLFGIASLLCAFAPSLPWLLSARFAQGLASAMVVPNSLALLGRGFAGEAKGRAVGTWASAGAIAGAVGPVLGGWLVDAASWRLIFLLNVPIAALAVFLSLKFLRDEKSEISPAKLDALGAALATAGLGLATWGLTELSAGGFSASDLLILCAGLACLAIFLIVESAAGSRAMVPVGLLVAVPLAGLNLLTVLLYAAIGGLFVLVPYVLIETGRYSAMAAGAALLPLPLILALSSPTAGALASKLGPRPLLFAGPLMVAVGFALLVRMRYDQSYWSGVFPGILVISVGLAVTVAPLTIAVLASVEPRNVGVASGLNNAIARVAALIATASIGVVMSSSGETLMVSFAWAAAVGSILSAAAAASATLIARA